jgi:hypothetical protein
VLFKSVIQIRVVVPADPNGTGCTHGLNGPVLAGSVLNNAHGQA